MYTCLLIHGVGLSQEAAKFGVLNQNFAALVGGHSQMSLQNA